MQRLHQCGASALNRAETSRNHAAENGVLIDCLDMLDVSPEEIIHKRDEISRPRLRQIDKWVIEEVDVMHTMLRAAIIESHCIGIAVRRQGTNFTYP